MADLTTLWSDPAFAKLPADKQEQTVARVIGARDPKFAGLAPEEQNAIARNIMTRHGIGGGGGVAGAGEITAAPGRVARGLEDVGRTAAFGLGGITGAALGGTTGATLGGVGGAPGAVMGGTTGAAIGATAADAVIAWLNHKLYGTPIDMSRKAVAEDLLQNAQASVVGEMTGPIIGRVAAIPQIESATREAVGQSQIAARGFGERLTEKGQTALEGLAKTQQKAVSEAAPEAQKEVVERITGATPEKAATTVAPTLEVQHPAQFVEEQVVGPSAEALQAHTGLKNAYFGVKGRIQDAYGRQYEKILGPYKENRIQDFSPIRGVLDKWESIYEAKGTPVPSPIRRLIEEAQDIAPRSFLDTAVARTRGKLSPAAKLAIIKGGEVPSAPTVDHVLAFKQEAQKFMLHATNDQDAAIAGEFADAADRTLENAGGLPPEVHQSLRGLNQQYRDFKTTFSRTSAKAVATAQNPLEIAQHIFTDPAQADRIISNANPVERQHLAEAFGVWAREEPDRLMAKNEADALVKARIFGKLYPGTPFADPRSLLYVNTTLDNLEAAPQTKAALEQAIQQQQAQAIRDAAPEVKKAALAEAKRLGSIGQVITRRIEAANTAEEAAGIATEAFTGMNPEQFLQDMARQQTMLGAQIPKQIGVKEGPQIWFQRIASNPKTLPWVLGYGGLSWAAYGHPGFYTIMGGLAAGAGIRRFAQNAFIRSLDNPAAARAFLSGTAAAQRGVMAPLAQQTFKAAVADASRNIAFKGKPMEQAPAATETGTKKPAVEVKKGPTPLSREYNRSEAEKVAGGKNPERVDKIAKVMTDVRAGKTPDVQKDLRTGRLSMPTLKRMLSGMQQQNVPQMLARLTPTDMAHMLSVANPDERQWLEPAMRQRLAALASAGKMRPEQAHELLGGQEEAQA